MMPAELRVMQMIDSLSMAGAERVSVNYANAIAELGHNSFLCTTREEGPLKELVEDNVKIFFMQKKSLYDIKAYANLIKYVKENRISIIHAHSSSFFTAIIVKLFTGVKVVWHDHNGNRMYAKSRFNFSVKYFSYFFDYVVCVNKNLKIWAVDNLITFQSKIIYLPNYAELKFTKEAPMLPGLKGKRMVVLANLRNPKDHLNILNAFSILKEKGFDEWHLLLVGEDKVDKYSDTLKSYIKTNDLKNNVSILGARNDSAMILKACDIGIICSESEGLPMALLEYGLASLAVVSTDVGECSAVLDDGKAGKLVPVHNSVLLAESLEELISNSNIKESYARLYHKHIKLNYSKDMMINKIIEIYKSL